MEFPEIAKRWNHAGSPAGEGFQMPPTSPTSKMTILCSCRDPMTLYKKVYSLNEAEDSSLLTQIR
jgi:hypothetical protein